MFKQKVKLSDMRKFANDLFDNPEEVEKATLILKGILDACSPRISDVSNAMKGNPPANYKFIQRFLASNDPRKALNRLYLEEAPFILGDPTDIERYQARKTEYVGKLKDGKTRGFQILPLAFPYRGRAIPFHFISYSSRTIDAEATSRNLEHHRVIRELKELFGEKPLVMDREFSYESLFQSFVKEGMKFVIRLNISNQATIFDEDGQKVMFSLYPGEKVFHRGVYYKGKVRVNLAGEWREGFNEPLWVISNLEPEEALRAYKARMKIEESFKDLKSLLRLDKIMNKSRENMEKIVAMVLIVYAIGVLIGEIIRDRIYQGKKWRLYSGLFIFLKQNIPLPKEVVTEIIAMACSTFSKIILGGNVRTQV